MRKYNLTHCTLPLDKYIDGSKHFKWYEALYLEEWDTYARPTNIELQNIIKVARELDKVRDRLGVPLLITSWYRPEKYNLQIGGSLLSLHTKGLAVDFQVQGATTSELGEIKQIIINENLWPGRGEMNSTNWIHLDLHPFKKEWFYV